MNLRINRRTVLSGLAALSMAKAQGDIAGAPGPELSTKLQQFLLQSQHRDGSWPSDTYGVLRGGQALTPFVLFALLQANPTHTQSRATHKAMTWIGKHLRDGCLGVADRDVLEYPVYSTAMALRCFVMLVDSNRESIRADLTSRIGAMRDFLLAEQFVESRGFQPRDLAYGGWGFGGTQPPGQTGHMDLAHTRWALQALATSDGEPERFGPKAKVLLRLLQKHPHEDRGQPLGDNTVSVDPPYDGGFYFSPMVPAANKGRLVTAGKKTFFRSYATATCDGVLALLAAGVQPTDPRVTTALRWLESHPDWDYPDGIPREYPEPWGDAVFFYHQCVRAEVYRRLGVGGDWPSQLCRRLAQHLADDGSIRNRRSALMKEDDPILCSALSLMAVSEATRAADRQN